MRYGLVVLDTSPLQPSLQKEASQLVWLTTSTCRAIAPLPQEVQGAGLGVFLRQSGAGQSKQHQGRLTWENLELYTASDHNEFLAHL